MSTKTIISEVDQLWTARRSKFLEDAIPKLQNRFDMVAKTIQSSPSSNHKKQKTFPLFSKQNHKLMWKRVPPREDQERAAILVPLVTVRGEPSLLFTTRSSHMPSHAAEVSFPGGHFHKGVDKSLEHTAIRETKEELLGDYPWDEIQIIGRATTVPSIKGIPVTPIISVLPHDLDDFDTEYMKKIFPGCEDEVENVFAVALRELLDIETSQPSKRFGSDIPVFPTLEGHRIWGLTAAVVRPILHQLFQPEFDIPKKLTMKPSSPAFSSSNSTSSSSTTKALSKEDQDLERNMKIPWDNTSETIDPSNDTSGPRSKL